MLKKYFQFLIISSLILISFLMPRPVEAAATFNDVPEWHWAYDWIERLYNAGVTSGCSQTPMLYCPLDSVNRAQMAKFLLTAIYGEGYTPPAVGNSTGFNDVPTDHWAAAWIKQLSMEGLTNGCGDGNYCPFDAVTRAQMAKFLLMAKHGSWYNPPDVGDNTGFFDVLTSFWAAAWIKQLAIEGITSGCGSGNYCPFDNVTREQMAKFLVITFDLPPLEEEPTPGPMPGQNEQCNTYGDVLICASVSNASPVQNSNVTVYGRLTINGWAQPDKQMFTTWHYKSTTPTCNDGITNIDGIANCARSIGRATIGYQVNIDVTIDGYSVTTSFTPID
jgi:hypothetical protein